MSGQVQPVVIGVDVVKTRRGYTGQVYVGDQVVHETETSNFAHQAESDAIGDLVDVIRGLFNALQAERQREIAELAE